MWIALIALIALIAWLRLYFEIVEYLVDEYLDG